MAASASTTRPMAHGQAHLLDQPQEEMCEALVQAIEGLSGEKWFKYVTKLREENESLKAYALNLENQNKGWEDSKKGLMRLVAEIGDENKKTTAISEKKDKELSEIKTREGKAIESLKTSERQVEVLKKELEANGKEMTRISQASNEKSDRITKLQSQIDTGKQVLQNYQGEANTAKSELEKVRKELATTSDKLALLQGLAVTLDKTGSRLALKPHQEKLEHIFEEVQKLVEDHFGQSDVRMDVFHSKSWNNLMQNKRLAGIPLPPTNTPAAKGTRAIAVLRLIALAAVEHLFQPVYLTGLDTEPGCVLTRLYDMDRPRAQLVRSVLLKVDQGSHIANGKKRAEAALEDVFEQVKILLMSSDGSMKRENDFRKAMQKWYEKAREVWMELQKLEGICTTLFDVDMESLQLSQWKMLPDKLTQSTQPTQNGTPAKANGGKRQSGPPKIGGGDIVAQVWPLFYIWKEEDRGPKPIKRGYLLQRSQVAAAQEEADTRLRTRNGGNVQNGLMALGQGSNRSTDNINSFLSDCD